MSWQGQAAYGAGQAIGNALVDFLFSKPKNSGPSPEEVRAEQIRRAQIAEAQRLEQQRLEAERQRRENLQRAARWRTRIDQSEAEMTEQLEGAFDVVRKSPSTNFFGSGNSDVSIGDDSGDTSVVDFRDRNDGQELSLSASFLLEQQRRAEATEKFRLQQTPYAVDPRNAGDSRYEPILDRAVEGAKDFARDVADEAKERILDSLDIPGLKGARDVWDRENAIIKDWERTMNPYQIAQAAMNGGSIGDDELRLRTFRGLSNDHTLGLVSEQTILAGDPRAAAAEGIRNYAQRKWDNFIDVPGRLREGAKDQVLRLVGFGSND